MIFTYWGHPPDGRDDEPKLVAAHEWRDRFTDFRVFGEADVRRIIAKVDQDYLPIFDAISIPTCKSHLARLLLLHEFGGTYVDCHVGVGSPSLLLRTMRKLEDKEFVLFDRTWLHKPEGDRALLDSVLMAQRHSSIARVLLDGCFQNLAKHCMREMATAEHVAYNIYVLTGPWNILDRLFDRTAQGTILKAPYGDRVEIVGLVQGEEPGFRLYAHHDERQPGNHWSARQDHERLFRLPSPPALSNRVSGIA